MNTAFNILLTTGLAFCLTASVTAAVYKHVDENGNVTFSDVPPTKDAEELELQPLNTVPGIEVTPSPSNTSPVESESASNYQSLAISQPLHDVAIRDNSGNVSIAISVDPGLQGSDVMVITMDGAEISRGPTTSVSLSNVDRGTHTLAAKIVDAEGNLLIKATDVVFHLQRVSSLN